MTESQSVPSGMDVASELRVVLVRLLRQIRMTSGRGLTSSQSSVLARVEECGPLRVGALSEAEGIAPATISRLVDGLVKQDLLQRVSDPVDGRASLVQMSPGGSALLHDVRARATTFLLAALGLISPADRQLLRDALPALRSLTEHLQGATGASIPPAD